MKINQALEIICEVTQEDIDKGLKGNAASCPIALSLRRKGLSLVSVGNRMVDIENKHKRYNAELSKAQSKFIDRFDVGIFVKPTKFKFKFKQV